MVLVKTVENFFKFNFKNKIKINKNKYFCVMKGCWKDPKGTTRMVDNNGTIIN